MSQCILCKGNKPFKKIEGIKIIEYPFNDSFYNEICNLLWGNEFKNDIWSIEVEDNLDIDDYFTEAQKQIYKNIKFEETKLYYILNELLFYNIEIVLWYSDIINNIPRVYNKSDFIKKVLGGIKNEWCEVYARYKVK